MEPEEVNDVERCPWSVCKLCEDFEINDETHEIRRKCDHFVPKPNQHKSGYVQIRLNKTVPYHRVIATQYIDNPDNLTDVDHIDGVRNNNDISNLRWKSRSENLKGRKPFKLGNRNFQDAMPDGCIPIIKYQGNVYENYWLDPETDDIWHRTKTSKYLKLAVSKNGSVTMIDANNKTCSRGLKRLSKTIKRKKAAADRGEDDSDLDDNIDDFKDEWESIRKAYDDSSSSACSCENASDDEESVVDDD